MTLTAPPLSLPSTETLSSSSITVDIQVEKTSTDLLTIRQTAQSAVLPASTHAPPVDTSTGTLKSIHAMIAKYNYGWKSLSEYLNPRAPPLKERVVVTGTTGALGSYLLAHLLENDRVEKVWAMNRRSREVEQRQRASFIDKGLDVGLLKSNKLVLVEANLEAEDLGVEAELFDEIKNTATIIIHNAWQVNFNFTLEQFEPSIKSVRNLLDFAFGSTSPTGPPRFVFTSSFSAAGFGKPGHHLMEGYLTPEDAATAIGYGQSKFVTEKLLESAREAGLETCVVRLGQLTGDVDSGCWPINNWVPLIVASSVSVGCLPGAAGHVSWIPLAIASRSIVDISTSRSGVIPPVIHPSHPYPIQWLHMFTMFADGLKTRNESTHILPIVPFSEWNERVKNAVSLFQGSQRDTYRRFPSTKIQTTMEAMARADQVLRSQGELARIEAVGFPRLDTSEAERLSVTLRNTTPLCQTHVEKWIGYWINMGLFRQGKANFVYSRL